MQSLVFEFINEIKQLSSIILNYIIYPDKRTKLVYFFLPVTSSSFFNAITYFKFLFVLQTVGNFPAIQVHSFCVPDYHVCRYEKFCDNKSSCFFHAVKNANFKYSNLMYMCEQNSAFRCIVRSKRFFTCVLCMNQPLFVQS